MKILVLPLLVSLVCSGCALRKASPVESYDALSGLAHADQVKNLAAAVSERLVARYPQSLIYVEDTQGNGMFGDALRYALGRNNVLAMRKDMANLSVIYVLGELSPGTGYLNLRFSDGTAMAQSFALQPLPGVTPVSPAVPAVYKPVMNGPLPEEQAAESLPVSAVPSFLPSYPREESPQPIPAIGHQNRPLREAVLRNLPYGWKYTIPDASRRKIRVSWPEDAFWRTSIGMAAEQAGCRADFDEEARRVRIVTVADMSATQTAPSAEAPAAPVSAVLNELADRKPFSPPIGTEWELAPGSLEAQLRDWCAKADWQLLWKADHDIRLQAHSIMRGDFEKAVTEVFQALHTQGNSLRATLYKTNSVLEIKDN